MEATVDGFKLIARNAGRFGLSSGLFGLFSVLRSITITLISGLISIIIIAKSGLSNNMEYSWVFYILAIVIGYFMADLYMKIFVIIGETLLHCYVVDEELHKEAGAKFCPDAFELVMQTQEKITE